MRSLLARGVHAGLVMFVASCTEIDPLYCPQHPEDLVNCAPANCTVVAELGVTVCPENFPSAVMIGSNVSIDTSAGASNTGIDCARLVSPSSDVCVVHGSSIAIASGARLTASGARPLVVLASTAIAIEGTLDVASRSGGSPVLGPAANPIDCVPGTAPTDNGGGYGGSFTTSGGAGGSAVNTTATGGLPGPIAPTASKLRGGCPGSTGSSTGGTGGDKGNGGGAVLLVGDSISIGATGAINASGSSGAGSSQGGGGGGAGGMIALYAPSVTVMPGGQMFANGGHGGEGGGSTAAGQSGTDPDSYTSGGGGGMGAAASGGDGGPGYPATMNNGADGTGTVGSGGGGGGGAGAILVLDGGSLAGVIGVSPPPP